MRRQAMHSQMGRLCAQGQRSAASPKAVASKVVMPQLFFAENFQKFPTRDMSALKFPVQRVWKNSKN